MKINYITPQFKNTLLTHHKTQQESHNETQITDTLKSVDSRYFIGYQPNFQGGYSLSLEKTIENLDKLVSKYPDIYPKHIREWAQMTLENGNKTKDTLIDIHKKLYENIKSCFSLDELKARFPEFEGVKSADEVDFREGSLLDDLHSGKLEFFNQDEDLSLQIIKLYWGEGFSLNDLKAYAGGKDLNNIMNKLHIPKVNRHYGQVLKLSDPEYNERLTKQMAQKRRETMDIRAQQQDGEPVYIRRGPLSPEHKQHISEGLLKFYRENPERVFAMSERQKKFYEDNPEQRKILHRVMVRAWNVFGADNIKKALSKFMKSNGIKDVIDDDIIAPEKMSKEKSALMKKFWASNEWARKSFSKNMEYAWKKIKAEKDMFYTYDLTPELFKKRFFAWCKKEGIDSTDLNFDNFRYYPHKPELNMLDSVKVNQYTPKYIDSCPGDESQKIANSYLMTMIKFGQFLKGLDSAHITSDTKLLCKELRQLINAAIFDYDRAILGVPTPRSFGADEIQRIYVAVSTKLMDNHESKLLKKLSEILNNSYNYLDKNWKAGQPMMLDPDAHLF